MKKIILLPILLFYFNIYAAPISYSIAPSINAYLSDDFQNNILPSLNPVSDIYYQKAVKQYLPLYTQDEFTLYQNKQDNKNSIVIPKNYLYPTSVLAMQIYLVEEQGDFSFVEIFFIESTGKISQVYSISGYVLSSQFMKGNNKFTMTPQWLYGTLALIYHDSSPYSDYDIIEDNESMRVASLIFIPENHEFYNNLENIALYPALNVINKKNTKINFLVKDRRILSYFNKYEVEPQGTFQKYLGGAITMKAYIYAYTYSRIKDNNQNKLEILSIPALFQLEKDKGYNRSFAYQKSYYKSLATKESNESIKVFDSPNGNIITTIDKTYYKSRDILYTPWYNTYVGQELWYAVILPKLNKTGYVLSSTVKIIEQGKR